jgi:hypothetical protein
MHTGFCNLTLCSEYQVLDDEEDGLGWNEDAPKIQPKARRERPPKSTATKASSMDKDTLLARYKVMQVPIQDKSGNFFWMRKKVTLPDLNLPTYIRIPSASMPHSWIKTILPLSLVQENNLGRLVFLLHYYNDHR